MYHVYVFKTTDIPCYIIIHSTQLTMLHSNAIGFKVIIESLVCILVAFVGSAGTWPRG